MERLEELGQEQVNGLQTLSGFLDRRLTPAVRTCEAAWDRLENIASRIDRATDLIRTQVDLTIEEHTHSYHHSSSNAICVPVQQDRHETDSPGS